MGGCVHDTHGINYVGRTLKGDDHMAQLAQPASSADGEMKANHKEKAQRHKMRI
jgi:hypothetical protein